MLLLNTIYRKWPKKSIETKYVFQYIKEEIVFGK